MTAFRSIALAAATVAIAVTGVGAQTTSLLDPNTATSAQLAAIPGLDAAKAGAVIAGRPYATALAFDSVLVKQGLTAEQRTAVYRAAFVRLDLNTASDAEILLVPGLGRRMLHEFKEYRPYKAMPQFRREIGKYVDEKEVARLEMYVKI